MARPALPARLRPLLRAALFAALAAQAGLPPAAVQAQPAARRYEIPAGPLGAALSAYAAQAGVVLSFDPDLTRGKATAGLAGTYTVREGLARLLRDSGLELEAQSDGSYTLRAAAVSTLPTVQVEGRPESAWAPVEGYVATRNSSGLKLDAPLVETPQSVSVVTRDQIADTDSQNLAQALRYTPGVISQEGNDHTTDSFIVRGFQLGGYGNTYRDGMKYMGNSYDGTQETYGLERIEVLRGAASVLYGETSPGGIINAVSKLPTLDPVHELRTELGNYGRRQIATDHGGRLTEDGTWSYRLVALARDSDTMVQHVPDDRTYIAPALRWQPTAATSLTLLGTYQRSRTAYVYGLPEVGTLRPSADGRIPTRRFLGEPDYDEAVIRSHDVGYRFEHAFNDTLKVRQNLRYFTADNDLPSTGLRSYVPGTGNTVIQRSAQDRRDHSENFVVDTQLEARLATGPLAHTLLGGVDYSDRLHRTVRYNRTLAPLDVYDPQYGAEPGPRVPAPVSSRTDTHRLGVYLQDQMKLHDRWVLLLGGRYDWARDSARALFMDASSRQKSEAFTGRAGLVYLADNGLAPYISFSQSFEPVEGTDRQGAPFDPTEGEQYEAGIRYQPKGSDMLLSAAVYQLTQTNVSTPDPVDPLQYQVQTGEVRSRGLELEAHLPLGRNARLIASYAYTDARTTRSNNPAEVDQRRGGAPRNTFGLWADYRFADFGLPQLRAGAGLRYLSSTLGLFNPAIEVPSYTIVDAMLGYDAGPWQLRLNANNLADRKYVAAYSYGAFYGPRRSVTASVAYRW